MSARIITSGLEDEGAAPPPGSGRADANFSVSWSGGGTSILLHPPLAADIDGVFESDLVIPAGTIGAFLSVLIGPRSGTITGTYAIEQLALKKIS